MTKTFHIHFQGIVQGVGFRPFVYKSARQFRLKGWVNNTNDGVHIVFNASPESAEDFYKFLLQNLPPLAVITNKKLEEYPHEEFNDFQIIESEGKTKPQLLITPDVAMCPDCRRELYDPANRRYRYPFITCTNCGPRYSIITALPYDRPNTTMTKFEMCDVCLEEYNNPLERRHFSQTNSCPHCAVQMQWYENGQIIENFSDLDKVFDYWKQGKIIAIKGIGGYLLTCDATNRQAVETLRQRKNRPAKPFALMYPGLESLKKDVNISPAEEKQLLSLHAPIMLLALKPEPFYGLQLDAITRGLNKIGAMLPYTPLMDLLLSAFGKPIVATSGNISGSPIIHDDRTAMTRLSRIADALLMNNRDITVPQDDGVEQKSFYGDRIITLRRSRGKAPVFIHPGLKPAKSVLATGAMLKSVFGFSHEGNIYISQYLGDTSEFESQESYEKVFRHLETILQPEFDAMVSDIHPGYFTTDFASQISRKYGVPHFQIQHHKAHFLSVLGENDLLNSREPVLGIVWDGTGLGTDGQIWGGEFFEYTSGNEIRRIAHIGSFKHILGDKMVREPRISALSVLSEYAPEHISFLQEKFNEHERENYSKLIRQSRLRSTSMGRLFDAVASLLNLTDIHSYDAEASIRLENSAWQYFYENGIDFHLSYLQDELPENFTEFIISQILKDIFAKTEKSLIAARFHLSLARYIFLVAEKHNYKHIAFSGGVFQNAVLTGLILKIFEKTGKKLYFHKELSPNDEGIAFGQLVYGLQKLNVL